MAKSDVEDAVIVQYGVEPSENPDDVEFQKIMDEMEGDEQSEIRVYREEAGSSKQEYLFKFNPGKYSYTELLEYLRENYGSGTYWLKGYDPRSPNRNKMVFNKNVKIGAPKTLPNSGQQNSGVSEVLALLREQNERLERALLSRQQSALPENWLEKVPHILTGVASVITVFKELIPKRSESTLMERLEEFQLLKEIMGGDDNEPSGSAVLLKSLESMGPALIRAIERDQEYRAAVLANLQRKKAAPNPQPKSEPQNQEQNEMTKNLVMLLSAAEAGHPVSDYVGLVMRFVSDENVDQVYEMISRDDFMDISMAQFPVPVRERMNKQRAWFDELRAQVIAKIEEEFPIEPEPLTPESESGMDTAHADKNAT